MDEGLTIIFIASIILSLIFIGVACWRCLRFWSKNNDNEFYVVKKNNKRQNDFELIER